MVLTRADYLRMSEIYDRRFALEASDINTKYQESSGDPIFYGLPHTKQYPMPDEKHVRSAIRFFNYVSNEDEEELASNINKMIKKFNITDLNVGPTNRFKKYYKGSTESVMTNTAPIIPYGKRLTKPGMESSNSSDDSDGRSGKNFENVKTAEGMKLHPVFFTLSYHEAGFGKFIKFMTHAPYSHCVLFFDSSLERGYSFAGREGHKMIPYGFVQESMRHWAEKNPSARYALYCMYLDDEDFNAVRNKVKSFYDRRTDFRYDALGCAKTFLGLRSANDTRYFCSGFVAMCLSEAKGKHFMKTYDMYKPMDMTDAFEVHLVDMGIAGNYNPRYVDKRVKEIYNKTYAKRLASAEKKKHREEKSNPDDNSQQKPTNQNNQNPSDGKVKFGTAGQATTNDHNDSENKKMEGN